MRLVALVRGKVEADDHVMGINLCTIGSGKNCRRTANECARCVLRRAAEDASNELPSRRPRGMVPGSRSSPLLSRWRRKDPLSHPLGRGAS
eukprot:CAMPEP_0206065782 /NCGR_PEP_ID=MMETSP1466-20131121/59404_1 /ASSEMBLY_ACC=CAM_ASM_001126 /TAXON_ID=44452 /ORGANISM="Pavlova gyrans, Strain CCMP608" /LENGTH=90 /DNA_ID=CAMNT_0053441159 /DNA_START=749 /DNA_END=1021 /DNA_ORIENTATION=-